MAWKTGASARIYERAGKNCRNHSESEPSHFRNRMAVSSARVVSDGSAVLSRPGLSAHTQG